MSWLKNNLFNTPFNALLTLTLLFSLYMLSAPLLSWLIFDSHVSTSPEACRQGTGACWSFIQEKWRLIIFGRYPIEEQWRPSIAMAGFFVLVIATTFKACWRWPLALAWLVFIPSVAILLAGGWFGLKAIDNAQWGGLPLTLLLSSIGIIFAYPMGILLALGRQSKLPAIKWLCVSYIELIRGVPLITLLFMGSIVLPLFLPGDVTLDELLRAQIAIILFAAAYLAEVIRAGLQAIPRGQFEAADALGLTKFQSLKLIVLPQALTIVIPVTVSTFIELFKDTSLVLIVSLMDLMLSTKTATIDAKWQGFSTEAYLFTAVIYFCCCYAMACYAKKLEKDLNKGHQT